MEAAGYARGRDNVCRLHFTVSAEHLDRFAVLLERVGGSYERRFGVRYDDRYSVQMPSTDTLALAPDGLPARDTQGRLLLRPAGHGALIENLAGVDADVVFIKNIDNVQPDRARQATVDWKRTLAGYLIRVQRR